MRMRGRTRPAVAINRCMEDGMTLDAMDSILVTFERVQRGMVALLTTFSPEMVTQNLRAMDMVQEYPRLSLGSTGSTYLSK